MRHLRQPLCFLFLLTAGLAAMAAPDFPALTGRVVDQAGIIPAAIESGIESRLAAEEARTGNQLVVVTLPSLQGYDIADYGYQLGRHWKIGQEGRDNGALLLVAPNERAVRIEVGYGLEGSLTDALSRIIIDNAILPRFREDDMPGGISAGVDDILRVLDGDGAEMQRLAEERARASDMRDTLIMIAFWVVFFIILVSIMRHGSGMSGGGPGNGGWPAGRRRSGGFSGRGGGFSGGGGSFGGGGASGRW